MEALVFAIVAVRKGYHQDESSVPEPAKFRPFDLGELKRSYEAEDDSSSRPSAQGKPLVTQIAS
jgi:hypothetical protein